MAGTVNPLLVTKAIAGMSGSLHGNWPSVAGSSLENHILPVYVANFGVNGIFGVHPHGKWRGGNIHYSPERNATLYQTLTNVSNDYTSAGTPVSQQLVTNGTGETYYLTSLYCISDRASATTFFLRDGTSDGGDIVFPGVVCGAGAYTEPIQMSNLEAPLQFDTGVRLDAGDQIASTRYVYFFTGYLDNG